AVVPRCEAFEFVATQRLFRERSTPDGDAYTRRLPSDTGRLWNRLDGEYDAASDQPTPALVLAREDEYRVPHGNLPAAVHRLLLLERECLRVRITNFCFDGERHSRCFLRAACHR